MSDQQIISEFMLDYNNHRSAVTQCMTALTRREGYDIPYISKLMSRAFNHDKSKEYNFEEFSGYIEMNKELKGVQYGSDEYKKIMEKYKYVINLHYKNNDHHPEHFENGFDDMNRLQRHEMICDWVGSMICRNQVKNFESSMKMNKERFNIPDNCWKELYDIGKYLIENVK